VGLWTETKNLMDWRCKPGKSMCPFIMYLIFLYCLITRIIVTIITLIPIFIILIIKKWFNKNSSFECGININSITMSSCCTFWLNVWLFPHYFINNCNLIDNSFVVTNIGDRLMSINKTWLSTWSVDNYIQKRLKLNDCTQNISQL